MSVRFSYLGLVVVIVTIIGLLLRPMTRSEDRRIRYGGCALLSGLLIGFALFIWATIVHMVFDVTRVCLPPADLLGSRCDLPPT